MNGISVALSDPRRRFARSVLARMAAGSPTSRSRTLIADSGSLTRRKQSASGCALRRRAP